MSYLISVFLILTLSLLASQSRISNIKNSQNERNTTTVKVASSATADSGRQTPSSSPSERGRSQNTYKPKPTIPTPKPQPKPVIKSAPKPQNNSVTSWEIINLTNEERIKNNAPSLVSNNLLKYIAEMRIEDMIARDYFAHTSPTGENIITLSGSYGYEYSYLGENLASGDFSSSQSMVSGWMQSPGHRQNILNFDFSEIGVAITSTVYMGRKQWLGVQVFGRPR